MVKLRIGDPWMPAPDYGRSLSGLGINLLVREIEAALPFQTEVLDAEVVYRDPDIAVLRREDIEWMLHAHHTYDAHPWRPIITSDAPRGVGVELRLHGRDPDAAEAAARRLGFGIIQAATDKPHGLREAYIADRDGYVWVPDVPLASPAAGRAGESSPSSPGLRPALDERNASGVSSSMRRSETRLPAVNRMGGARRWFRRAPPRSR